MNKPTNPSADTLSAYLDGELSEAECSRIESRIENEPETRALLEEFRALNDLGPTIEESMPGDAYWLDLPDRVLARIAAEERSATVPAPVAEGSAWWQRLFAPQATWRWAAATAVVAVVGAGVVLRSDPATETAPGLAALDPATTSSSGSSPSGITSTSSSVTPTASDEYVRRVATTLGDQTNLGTMLDQTGVTAMSGTGDAGPVTQVSFGDLQVPQSREPQSVVSEMGSKNGCGITDAFHIARYCEENGSQSDAMYGYRLVYNNTQEGELLHLAANVGLTRGFWRQQLSSGDQVNATDTFGQLTAAANTAYRSHEAGDHTRCENTWALHLTLMDLGRGHLSAQELAEVQQHMRAVEHCVK